MEHLCIAVMNDHIAKFGYDSMQQITKNPKIYGKYLTDNLQGKIFNFYRDCILQKTCFVACKVHELRHDVNNGVKCK